MDNSYKKNRKMINQYQKNYKRYKMINFQIHNLYKKNRKTVTSILQKIIKWHN